MGTLLYMTREMDEGLERKGREGKKKGNTKVRGKGTQRKME